MSEYPTYLVHFGIKGQRWGIRRYQNEDGTLTAEGKIRAKRDAFYANKWATSKNQPSSIKTSFAAGKYKANPNAKNAEKIRKLNNRDSIRWKSAKEEYNKLSKFQRGKNFEINRRSNNRAKIAALAVGGAFAAKSFSDSVKNYKAVNAFLYDFGQRVPASTLVTKGTAKAAIVAGTAIAATYGTIKLSQFIKNNKRIKKEYKRSKNNVTSYKIRDKYSKYTKY